MPVAIRFTPLKILKPTETSGQTFSTPRTLPPELIHEILAYLDAPSKFAIFSLLRSIDCQIKLLPSLFCLSLEHASLSSNLHLLSLWRLLISKVEFRSKFTYSHNAIDNASASGFVEVLEWWRTSELPLKWTGKALSEASQNGFVHILDWWNTHGFLENPACYKWVQHAFDIANFKGRVNVLAWWRKSRIKVQTDDVVFLACSSGHTSVLDFWKGDMRESRILWDERSINEASEYGIVNVLEWWKCSGLQLKYNEDALDNATSVEVLNWWMSSGLQLRWTHKAMDNASDASVLEWWKNSGLELKWTKKAMENASNESIVKWWQNSGLELKGLFRDTQRENDLILPQFRSPTINFFPRPPDPNHILDRIRIF
ncbi:hypothetical protein HK096_005802 [Nowakowskiella sp. JEL0078]|nr:hypothetical protein HK096_005802 [Nowakowskiella sp. JEL0078]